MSAEAASQDKLVYVVESEYATSYHLRGDCPNYGGASWPSARVPLSTVPDRELCGLCENPIEDGNWKNGECRHCGQFKINGECRFCDAFDRVHDVPADAEFCPLDAREVVAE